MIAALRLLGVRDWVIVALCLALAGAIGYGKMESSRADRAVASAASWKSAHDTLVTNIKAAEKLAKDQQKERERESQARVDQAREQERAAAVKNQARLAAAVAAERADARSLRDQLAERLGEPCQTGQAAGPPSDDQAAAIGDVLAEALRVQAELASSAERHAGEVRALLDAWPGN